jgi:colanic acid/amylovoran biosynthesis glycosyltransferase
VTTADWRRVVDQNREEALDASSGGRPAAGSARSKARVAYFVNLFPTFIETMIYREVGALRSMGYEIVTFSVRRPERDEVPDEASHFLDGTHYILPMSAWRIMRAHAEAIRRWPFRYASTLLRCVMGSHGRFRDRLRTIGHFLWAIAALPVVERAGVSHLHAHWATGPTTAAMVLSRLLGIPFSFTAHAYDVWREQLLLPEKLRSATFAVTCTEYNRQHLAATYAVSLDKVVTVHHGVDVHRYGSVERTPKGEARVISVGRLVEQKGFDRLLRACKRLVESGEAFRCEIVGDGPLRERLEGLVDEYRLRDHVTLVGRLHQDDLRKRYAAADMFVLFCVPASDEDRDGIPNVLIEAMATELPVVSTKFSGVPEIVMDGETGILVATDDERAQAEAVRRMLRDPALRRGMGRAGRRRVMEGFTIEASAAHLDAVFSRLAS